MGYVMVEMVGKLSVLVGGFILFQSSDTQKLKTMLKKKSLQVVDFEFTSTGTEIIKL